MIFEQTAGKLLDKAIIIKALSDSLAQAKFVNDIKKERESRGLEFKRHIDRSLEKLGNPPSQERRDRWWTPLHGNPR